MMIMVMVMMMVMMVMMTTPVLLLSYFYPMTLIFFPLSFFLDDSTLVLCVEASEIGPQEVFSHEKLSPLLSLYKAGTFEQGVEMCRQIAEHGGLGHTSVIYSHNEKRVAHYQSRLPTYHIAVNMPSSLGVIGIKYNIGVFPTMTIGVGAAGGSMASGNVGPMELIQTKVVNFKRPSMQVFRTPTIYSRQYCLRIALENVAAGLPPHKSALIVSNQPTPRLEEELHKLGFHIESYREFSSIPTESDLQKGLTIARGAAVKPSIVIGAGDRASIDMAKLIRLHQV